MLLGLVFLGLGVVGLKHLLLTSKWMLSEHVLQRATQAAVMSAGHYQARVLNTHALLNRTQMAHQVAMAHLITVASALHHGQQMSIQAKRHNPPLYLIGAFFGPGHGAAYAASKMMMPPRSSGALNRLKQAFQAHDALIGRQIEANRQRLQLELNTQTRQVIYQTLAMNLNNTFTQHEPIGLSIPHVTVSIDQAGLTSDALVRDKNLTIWQPWFQAVMGQHDYLSPRHDTFRNHWIINPKCPHVRHALRRQGQTTVLAQGVYEARDSLSFHAMRKLFPVGCYLREYPMGWADVTSDSAAQATGARAPRRFNKMTFRQWASQAVNQVGWLIGLPRNNLAQSWASSQTQRWRSNPIPEPILIKQDAQAPFHISITVKQDQAWFAQSNSRVAWFTLGLNQISKGLSPKHLMASAGAEVYFEGYPLTRASVHERPNVFEPFWQAKRVH